MGKKSRIKAERSQRRREPIRYAWIDDETPEGQSIHLSFLVDTVSGEIVQSTSASTPEQDISQRTIQRIVEEGRDRVLRSLLLQNEMQRARSAPSDVM